MYTLVSYPAGILLEAIILKQTRNRIRMIAQGIPDTVELRRDSNGWHAEGGERFEFEFLATSAKTKTNSYALIASAAGSGASQN